MADLVVTLDRFVAGDFPRVCARTGNVSTGVIAIEARVIELPDETQGPIARFVNRWREPAQSFVPFIDDNVTGIVAEQFGRDGGVILRGVDEGFVAACERHWARREAGSGSGHVEMIRLGKDPSRATQIVAGLTRQGFRVRATEDGCGLLADSNDIAELRVSLAELAPDMFGS